MNLNEVIPIIIIFPTMYFIIKACLDYGTRKKLIEKGLVGEDIKYLYGNHIERFLPSSLKWGIVLILIGVAAVVLKLLPGYISAEVAFGVMLIAAGVGMLLFYGIASKKAKEAKRKEL